VRMLVIETRVPINTAVGFDEMRTALGTKDDANIFATLTKVCPDVGTNTTGRSRSVIRAALGQPVGETASVPRPSPTQQKQTGGPGTRSDFPDVDIRIESDLSTKNI